MRLKSMMAGFEKLSGFGGDVQIDQRGSLFSRPARQLMYSFRRFGYGNYYCRAFGRLPRLLCTGLSIFAVSRFVRLVTPISERDLCYCNGHCLGACIVLKCKYIQNVWYQVWFLDNRVSGQVSFFFFLFSPTVNFNVLRDHKITIIIQVFLFL